MFLSLLLLILTMAHNLRALTENQLHLLPNQTNFDNAVKLCQDKGWKLVKVTDVTTNVLVFDFALKNKIREYWIDGNDKAKKEEWRDSDGNLLQYKNWHPGEPSGGVEHCIEGLRYPNGLWNDINCDTPKYVICKADVDDNDCF